LSLSSPQASQDISDTNMKHGISSAEILKHYRATSNTQDEDSILIKAKDRTEMAMSIHVPVVYLQYLV